MTNKIPMIACMVVMFAMALLLTGAAAPEPAQWEYGMYVESPGNFDWHTASNHTRATNPVFFFERMGIPTNIETSTRTGRIQPLLLNHLGRQGWELVETATDSGRTTCWFKRPR
ncbi:MAG: hypothetical protein KBE65_01975 [Phycisphaerae bacterium]|nr:hypothetical protein [Phycisphaerae bacterium]